jgi:hypothetical protein
LVIERAIKLSPLELGFAHLTQRRCYFLTLNFFKMQNQEKITHRPVQSKNEQTIAKLVKVIKSFFKGNPVKKEPVYTHPTYLQQQRCKTINVNDLSPEARQHFNQLFDRVFSNVQFSN